MVALETPGLSQPRVEPEIERCRPRSENLSIGSASRMAGVDINQTLGITARFAHASNALHPTWFSALAAHLRRNEAETEQFLYERTRSPSTIGIVI